MGFFLSLIIIVGIQMAITWVLTIFGVPSLYIDLIIDLVLAFVFTFWNYSRVYRNNKKEIWKDFGFHMNVCIWFAILTGISIISNLMYL